MEDFSKNSRKKTKLKEKTQSSRKTLNASEDLSSATLPSDVKKGLAKGPTKLKSQIGTNLPRTLNIYLLS